MSDGTTPSPSREPGSPAGRLTILGGLGSALGALVAVLFGLSAGARDVDAVRGQGVGEARSLAAQERRNSVRHVEVESGFAVLASRPGSDVAAAVAVSSRVAGASRAILAAPGVGAVYVVGRHAGDAARRALESLRGGESPDAAVAAAAVAGQEGTGNTASGPGPLQAAALAESCATGHGAAERALPGTAARSGETPDGLCFLAAVTQPRNSLQLSRLVSGFRSATGTVVERLAATARDAMDRVEPEAEVSRSAALWVVGDGEPGGRGELRLQVEDHPRPVEELSRHLAEVRADAFVTRAGDALVEGRHEAALALADTALDENPALAAAWMHRGRALLHLERHEEAEVAFRRMLELDPMSLRHLGDPTVPQVNEAVIPYEPRLLLRLDVYRRAFFPDLDFPGETAVYDSIPERGGDPGGEGGG